jgi:hypothetical protein
VRVYLSSDENPKRDRNRGSGYRNSPVLVEDTAMTSLGVCDIAGGGGMDLGFENKSMFVDLQDL